MRLLPSRARRLTGRPALLALAALSVALALPIPAHAPTPAFCPVVGYRDFAHPLGYYLTFRLAPGCPHGRVGRLRKSSTLNTRAGGVTVQPIQPQTGAWTVTPQGDDVPNAKQFVYFYFGDRWEWQYFDGAAWVGVILP
jgi:hypothetical protein